MTTTTRGHIREVSSNASAFLCGSVSTVTIAEFVGGYFVDGDQDVDVEAVVADYRAAITRCLPAGVTLAGESVCCRADLRPDWDGIVEQAAGIDFAGIVDAHRISPSVWRPPCDTMRCTDQAVWRARLTANDAQQFDRAFCVRHATRWVGLVMAGWTLRLDAIEAGPRPDLGLDLAAAGFTLPARR